MNMKKIFTFLLLAACFAIPRSAEAVVWEVSDGTQYRINPKNPSDPNDTILIPAGTRFVRILCGYNSSKDSVFIPIAGCNTEYNSLHGVGGSNCSYDYVKTEFENMIVRAAIVTGRDNNLFISHPYTGGWGPNFSGRAKANHYIRLTECNIPDVAVRSRLAERILGYDWLKITYNSYQYLVEF